MKRDGSTTVVYAALAGKLAIAVTNFGAALYIRSSDMFNEALHSTVDTVDQRLLYGMFWAKRSPTRPTRSATALNCASGPSSSPL